MTHLHIAATIADAPVAAQPLLQAVQGQLGVVPNLFRLVANSPAALEGYLNLSGALGKGTLPAATRERIALAVAEANRCGYCLSAHTYLGKNLAGLSESEMIANRKGSSEDAMASAAVTFAAQVVSKRGHVGTDAVAAVKAAGYSDAQIVEIVLHVALNTWTNYINSVAGTEIDFPEIAPFAA